ncbi:Uma2 family endonuclease [Azospirillum picis]|uniref:Uma2 family endonuclease n=1 Tax=Azospirillum picis TaxID=488438 RepID=A0ABU0MPC7_9PROT|nr:Uma2 family endonuclease [Azospirillum picis]MBP2301496.1 Uma2 family endonuclease [Azospirillum picis]MDQ0535328.1 Uma2 family endonuclease [Azospirillum picis]
MPPARRFTPLVTVEDFLATEFAGEARYELVDGEVVGQAHPSPAHSALQVELGAALREALRDRARRDGTRCRALSEAGIRPQFDPTHNYRVADLAVTCEPFDPDVSFTVAPVLLVEILSPTEEKAQRAKLHVCAAMPSVREILFLDSRIIRAELHRRDADGRWPVAPLGAGGGLRAGAGDGRVDDAAGRALPRPRLLSRKAERPDEVSRCLTAEARA